MSEETTQNSISSPDQTMTDQSVSGPPTPVRQDISVAIIGDEVDEDEEVPEINDLNLAILPLVRQNNDNDPNLAILPLVRQNNRPPNEVLPAIEDMKFPTDKKKSGN